MIVYGTKGSHLKSEKINAIKCSRCEQTETHTMSVYGKYAYLYWLPVFPLSKKGFSECQNCKSTLEPQEMNPQLRSRFNDFQENVKTPVTYWSGLIIIGLFMLYMVSIGLFR